ncbi:LCI fold-containing protein [Paenibacillus chitinolyticus]|uniref:LCI fold-containing protein n=1 Tax=Paenibacillus chitinolyticus TaxID=79263 RepID=UPI0036DADB2D
MQIRALILKLKVEEDAPKDTIQDRYLKNRTGIFSDHFTENGTTGYIKGITSERVSNDGGYVVYTAHYQAHVCG